MRVCIVGCGAVTQAIHVPVLTAMREQLAVTLVVDPDAGLARAVADRTGARTAPTLTEALAAEVDVVAICSPSDLHAQHVTEACAAGVRVILCEKPLALTLDEARAIERAANRAGVPVLVATMHAYDPAYQRARRAWQGTGATRYVESICFLPGNDRYIALATELEPPRAEPPPARGRSGVTPAGVIHGLASHHIPLVSDLMGGIGQVLAARTLEPFGYDVTLRNGGVIGRMVALMAGAAEPHWTVRAVSADGELTATFPPSYVQAGSSTASVRLDGVTQTWRGEESGYAEEWQAVYRAALAGDPDQDALARAVADMEAAEKVVAAMGTAPGGAG